MISGVGWVNYHPKEGWCGRVHQSLLAAQRCRDGISNRPVKRLPRDGQVILRSIGLDDSGSPILGKPFCPDPEALLSQVPLGKPLVPEVFFVKRIRVDTIPNEMLMKKK